MGNGGGDRTCFGWVLFWFCWMAFDGFFRSRTDVFPFLFFLSFGSTAGDIQLLGALDIDPSYATGAAELVELGPTSRPERFQDHGKGGVLDTPDVFHPITTPSVVLVMD